nr:benzoate/H(+) symporter BenE family transporter [Pseudomonas sp.]
GLTQAMHTPHEREAALITFMVTASGLTLFGIGAALWGLIAGVVTLVILSKRG